ncbi:bromodomain adjacent to zinc finger domain protein 2B isoform X2 [Lutzomyia longipalpis]|uniref:bromodomain adjacent to zinc finger domain protein 2B isoform X2 n=1 Tax=Lutzomyia longipalpis TaxID=7200 RepID=UPI002483842B|nr:bromodomain adjacent to zinc finger domain protein 2B isoform X2 [Lutzomyia longipalpis]
MSSNHSKSKEKEQRKNDLDQLNRLGDAQSIFDWWSMAQLAAQEYFTRLHTTPNLAAQMPFGRADLAAMFNPAAMGLTGDANEQQKNAMADAYRLGDLSAILAKSYGMNIPTGNERNDSVSTTVPSTSYEDSSRKSSESQPIITNSSQLGYHPGNFDLASLASKSRLFKGYMQEMTGSAPSDESDSSSLLGVRLPPDTEIIKYTSSKGGPKVPGGGADEQESSTGIAFDAAKRPRLDYDYNKYTKQNDQVEVIKLPPTATQAHQTKAMKEDLPIYQTEPLNLEDKHHSAGEVDSDGPLNLCMKPDSKSQSSKSDGGTSLQNLSSFTAAFGTNQQFDGNLQSKENRPRNLGRGVSKPKKNTVASLLAQSRAVGLKPSITSQLLLGQSSGTESTRPPSVPHQSRNIQDGQMDVSTDSESVITDYGGQSESETEEAINLEELLVPLNQGWKRETVIRGLTKTGQIIGDVIYMPPKSQLKLKTMEEVEIVIEKQYPVLTKDNFSFSTRAILGTFLQAPLTSTPVTREEDLIRMTDVDVMKRLEELKMYTRHTQLGVEQRIEIARQQQALRDVKKIVKEENAKRDKLKEHEKQDKTETHRQERQIRNQQSTEMARRKREESDRQKNEEMLRKMQEKELKKQKASERELEKERRRHHSGLVKLLEIRRKYEEREKKKHQMVLDKFIMREKKLATKKRDSEILCELRKPQEDSEIPCEQDLPKYERIPNLSLSGEAFADLLMVYEFLHNFGETLGFDMESLPTLQSLHFALVSDSGGEAEEELLSVITHLLVCAIEDPGIPNPGRHTTLLGQSLRQADITNANVSEILRIYLYAAATGEVKQLTGVNFERDREKRIADHHQTTSDMAITSTSGKNTQYYEYLHENSTWKLSECLRDKPFVALSPITKAQILAHLCNDLLMNKAVLKQIDGSLEMASAMRRDRYLIDIKLRKYKSLHARKVRLNMITAMLNRETSVEPTANEQATAAGKPPESAEKSFPEENQQQQGEFEKVPPDGNEELESKEDSANSSDAIKFAQDDGATAENHPQGNVDAHQDANHPETQHQESHTEVQSVEKKPPESDGEKAKHEFNDTDGDFSGKIRDLNDTGITDACLDDDISDLEEDIPLEEDEDEKLNVDEVQKKLEKVIKSSQMTRETLNTNLKRLRATCFGQDRYWRRYWDLPKAGGIFVEALESCQPEIVKYHEFLEMNVNRTSEDGDEEDEDEEEKSACEEDDEEEKPEVKSEKGDCIKREPLVDAANDDEMMDIEDSIPTNAILQKNVEKMDEEEMKPPPILVPEDVKKEEIIKEEVVEKKIVRKEEEPCREFRDDKMLITCDCDPKAHIGKLPVNCPETNGCMKNGDVPLLEKWFSILRKPVPLESECSISLQAHLAYMNVSCEGIVQCQGNPWDISNNIHFFNIHTDSSIFADLNMTNESVLTLSGISDREIERTLNRIDELHDDFDCEILDRKQGFGKGDDHLNGFHSQVTNFSLANLSAYIQCESPTPLQMTLEEQKQLEEVKEMGFPRKLEQNFVPRELRHGWWRITDEARVNEILQATHTRGVRETDLRQNLMQYLREKPNFGTNCHLTTDVEINGEFVDPKMVPAYNPRVCERVIKALLDQIEGLEDKVASASMQNKGWVLPTKTEDMETPEQAIEHLKERILGLEAAIERRYLKPPLGSCTADAHLAAIAQTNQEPPKETQSTSNPSASPNSYQETEHLSKGLVSWREAVCRSKTTAQLAMTLYVLESCVAWDKSIMKANCQFCHSGENEDKLLLCDGCDKGFHTYCFKPRMEKIPEGDWYCFECVNKATGERKCIVCGGLRPPPVGKMIYCELCPRAYHHDCYIPPLMKVPRNKWYCHGCITKAPPSKKRVRKNKSFNSSQGNSSMEESSSKTSSTSSSSGSIARTASTDDASLLTQSTSSASGQKSSGTFTPNTSAVADTSASVSDACESSLDENFVMPGTSVAVTTAPEVREKPKEEKKEKVSKKLIKEMALCKTILDEMELHEDAWPFLLPVNTKQFPTYKKIIKYPIDLSTIKKKVQDMVYKCRDEFVTDVRQIFNNCEVFNEDDSPVGKAGHGMRKFFELRWKELIDKNV